MSSNIHNMWNFFDDNINLEEYNQEQSKPSLSVETPNCWLPAHSLSDSDPFSQLLDDCPGLPVGSPSTLFTNDNLLDMMFPENSPLPQSLPTPNPPELPPLPSSPSPTYKTVAQQNTQPEAENQEPALKTSLSEDPQRQWNTVSSVSHYISGDISIRSKTRLDTPSLAIPDRLYASLKYELQQTASGVHSSLTFILAKARVCDADTGAHIESVKNVPSLRGTVEAALTRSAEEDSDHSVLSGGLKIQFGNKLSYHSTKKRYFLEVHYFLPDNLDDPIYIKRSAPFKVFARKPNIDPKKNTKTSTRKRKREDTPLGPRKAARIDSSSMSSSALSDFMTRLDDLVQVNSQLSPEDKKQAMDLVLSKFLLLDESLACHLMGSFGSS